MRAWLPSINRRIKCRSVAISSSYASLRFDSYFAMAHGRAYDENMPVLQREDRPITVRPGKPRRGHRTRSRDPQSGDGGAPQSSDWEVGTIPHPPLGPGGSTMVAERGLGPSARSGHESGSGRESSGDRPSDYLTGADDGSGRSDDERAVTRLKSVVVPVSNPGRGDVRSRDSPGSAPRRGPVSPASASPGRRRLVTASAHARARSSSSSDTSVGRGNRGHAPPPPPSRQGRPVTRHARTRRDSTSESTKRRPRARPARSKKRKQKRNENPGHSPRARHCGLEGTDDSTDRDSDGVSPVRDRHHQGPKGSMGSSLRGTHITATGYGLRRRCRGGDDSVESRSNSRHRNKKDSGRRNRRILESRIEVSNSDIESDSGDFHRRGKATEPSRHAPPAGPPHRGHRGHKKEAVHSAHKNREVGSPRRESRHKPHPDRVHSSREKHRHRPKVTELVEGESQGERTQKPRPTLPTLKLGSYDGNTCLATFLAKFTNCTEYYNWTDRDQLCHLRNSLEGRAGQVLWELGSNTTVSQLIQLLKNRFGTQDQTERYRLELKARKRKKNESLQSLYNDICRLMVLAYPGESGTLCSLIARDAFLEALDAQLRLKILERDTEPATLEDALRVATRLEAVRRTADDEYVEEVKKREKNIRGASQTTEVKNAQAEKKIADLETAVDDYKRELDQNRKELDRMKLLTEQLQQRVVVAEERERENVSRNWNSVPERWDGSSGWSGPGGQFPGMQGRGHPSRGSRPARWTRGRLSRDECRKCGGHGHWWRDCPQSQQQQPGEGRGTVKTSVVGPVEQKEYETYLEAEVDGKTIAFLLDSGSCSNILPASMVNPDEIRLNQTQLLAVNKSPIEVVGTITWDLTVGSQTLPVKFDVSEEVFEPILGIRFLSKYECRWYFAAKKIKIIDETVPLLSKDEIPGMGRITTVYRPESARVRWGGRPNYRSWVRPWGYTRLCRQCRLNSDKVKSPENETKTSDAAAGAGGAATSSAAIGTQQRAVTTRRRADRKHWPQRCNKNIGSDFNWPGHARQTRRQNSQTIKLNDKNCKILKQPRQKTGIVERLNCAQNDTASVSVVSRQVFPCPMCDYSGFSRRSMIRHCLGHHGAEWQGPSQPLRPVPPERAADARERLRLLQRNSRQRRRDRDRIGKGPGSPGRPRSRASAPGGGGRSRCPELVDAPAPLAGQCCRDGRTVPPTIHSDDRGDHVDAPLCGAFLSGRQLDEVVEAGQLPPAALAPTAADASSCCRGVAAIDQESNVVDPEPQVRPAPSPDAADPASFRPGPPLLRLKRTVTPALTAV